MSRAEMRRRIENLESHPLVVTSFHRGQALQLAVETHKADGWAVVTRAAEEYLAFLEAK